MDIDLDKILNYKSYDVLKSRLSDPRLRQNIKLLCVFGCGAAEVIYVTYEDKVYCYGRNRYGGLGLGSEIEIKEPQLNPTLSFKGVSDIIFGFEHWLALTTTGQVYAWGHNQSGQLGVGPSEAITTPKIIKKLAKVVQISCGGFHTLALTSNGQVFTWGDNRFGQLGTHSFNSSSVPINIFVGSGEKVVSVSCGKKHSMALTSSGKVFIWGINGYGQCGQSPTKYEMLCRPQLSPYVQSIVFSKAICGPNHSLLLTTDGFIYSFGENTVGQIGNGSVEHQFIPNRIREDIRFKDIVTNKENDLSIGVTKDNRFFIWGLANNRRYMTPVEDTSRLSLFDIYAKYAKNKIVMRTVYVDNELKFSTEMVDTGNGLDFISSVKQQEICDTVKEDLIYSNSCKRIQTVVKKTQPKTIDDYLDINHFLKNKSLIDTKMRKSIRLLFVFGIYGSKVIFATNEDKVYAFGHNRDGTLGLGFTEEHILELTLNEYLCGKQLVDISSGYEHVIALTANGECYGWGKNNYGQLGIGNIESQITPKLVKDLTDKKVVQISCGSYHSMALTSDGDLFSWGHNTFAQLGDRTYNSREEPTQVLISEPIASMSSGINHSLALTRTGHVYVWGVNESGQLGRERIRDLRPGRDKAMSNRPRLVPGIETFIFKKAICGPNHTLLLSSDGFLYVFGENKNGQIGNGLLVPQSQPFKLNNNLKIKDIITSFRDDISIAVSTDDKCFAWGHVLEEKVLRPKQVPESFGNSLFDIYVRLAKNKVTFKAFNINDKDINNYMISNGNQTKQSVKELKELSNNLVSNQKIVHSNYDSNEDFNQFYEYRDNSNDSSDEYFNETDNSMIGPIEPLATKEPSSVDTSSVYQSSSLTDSEPITGVIFLKYLYKSFNNSKTSDLIIRSDNNVIYCHKTILQIRNQKFWTLINDRLTQTENSKEIHINSDSFKVFFVFIEYLYGIEPEIDVNLMGDLLKMSEFFEEPELKDLVNQQMRLFTEAIDLSNVCDLYETAINSGFKELEESCIQFAVKNWKTILRSDSFQSMDDKLSKRFMLSINMR